MAYQDKSIQCADCGSTFTFSADEQEQFASRGYTNEPKRCSNCRQARKERMGNSGGGVMVHPAPAVKCSRLPVPSVEKTPKFRSNHARTDRFIAAIATIKSDRLDNTSTV